LLGQELAQVIGVIALVRKQSPHGSRGADQGGSHTDIVDVPGAEQQHTRPARIIDQAVKLGRAATS
jgi:hypothetical protein